MLTGDVIRYHSLFCLILFHQRNIHDDRHLVLQKLDVVLGEDVRSKFTISLPIEMYIESNQSWGGDTGHYRASAWTNLAASHKRAFPLCVECEKKGIVRMAKVTDHIIPAKQRPDLFYDWENLQSLCHPCHNAKSAKERIR